MKKQAFVLVLALLCGTAAHAQNFVGDEYALEYESPARYRPTPNSVEEVAFYYNKFADTRYDMTGDGIPEVVMTIQDEQGDDVEMVVFDMISRTQIWSWKVEEAEAFFIGRWGSRFLGFVNIDGVVGPREPLFIQPNAGGTDFKLIILDLVTKTPEFVLERVARAIVGDWDGDGFDELLVGNLDTETVQIWGNAGSNGQGSH
ncbi:MAG: hypothetical protein ACE5G0_09430 [Rhodothermales bacterium]